MSGRTVGWGGVDRELRVKLRSWVLKETPFLISSV